MKKCSTVRMTPEALRRLRAAATTANTSAAALVETAIIEKLYIWEAQIAANPKADFSHLLLSK